MSDSLEASSAIQSEVASESSEAPPQEEISASEEGGEGSEEQTVEEKIQEEIKELKKKYSLKVNGTSKEIELDLNNDAEVQKYLQKALASDEKFQEAASMRKQMESLIEHLKTNPLEILMHPELGIDVKALAEQVINKEFEELQKTPEQREQEKLQKELETLRKQLETEQEAKRTAEMERMREQAFTQLDQDITEALTASSSLPKSPYVVKRIADTMIEAVNLGYTDVSVKDVLPIVEQQISGEIQKMFEAMPEEVMESLIGKNNLTRMRKKRLATGKPAPATAKSIKDSGEAVKAKADQPTEAEKKRFKDIFGSY